MKSIYTVAPATHYNAVFEYRVITPMNALGRRYPTNIFIDPYSAEMETQVRVNAMGLADVCYLHTITTVMHFDVQRAFNEAKPKKNADGTLWYPPAFVQSLDDNVFAIEPANPGFFGWGYKDADGNELSGDQRMAVRGPDGEMLQDWVGNVSISWERNKLMVENYKKSLETAQLVVLSTPRLERVIKEMFPKVKTHILPNCVDFNEYPDLDIRPHDEVRIQWAGSIHHADDIYTIKDTLHKIVKKYDNVKLVWFCSDVLNFAIEGLPEEKVIRVPWYDFRAYKMRLTACAPDIFIAPLCDNAFNDAKSAIKFYEGAALPEPAPVVAPNLAEYADIVKHGETGMLYDTVEQFEEQLCTLIENVTLRKTLGRNAKDWVRDNRNIDDYARPLWLALKGAQLDRQDM